MSLNVVKVFSGVTAKSKQISLSLLNRLSAKLPLERNIKVTNPANLTLDLLSCLTDLYFVSLHPLVHLFEVVSLLVEIMVLLAENLLMLVQKVTEFVKFAVL